MKKIFIIFTFLPITFCFAVNAYASNENILPSQYNQDGFYVGGSIGYLWSAESSVSTTAGNSFFNPDFFLNGEITRRSLVRAAKNNIPLSLNSFIGGVQVGYDKLVSGRIILGLLTDIVFLSNSKQEGTVTKSTTFAASGLDYTSSVSVTKELNQLGTARGKLGIQATKNLQIYASAGLAYGRASLGSSTVINNFGDPKTFPPSSFQAMNKETKVGWGAGGGLAWMLFKTWSMNLEYFYYDLGKLNNKVALTKLVRDKGDVVVPYASADVNTSAKFNGNTIRIGVNKYFNT